MFFYKQPTILIESQRYLVFCDFQGDLLLSICLTFIKKKSGQQNFIKNENSVSKELKFKNVNWIL